MAMAAAVVAFLVLVLDDDGQASDGVGVTLADITDGQEQYAGRTVTVTDFIDEIVSRHAFTFEAAEGAVVVVTRRPVKRASAPPLREDALVRVTGRVVMSDSEEFDAALERAGDDTKLDLGDLPAVVDASVHAAASRLPAGSAPSATELESSPRDHIGELMSVEASVTRAIAPGVWTVGEDLLAVSDLRGARRLREGETARFTGVLRRFHPRRVKRDTGVDLPRKVRRRDGGYVLIVRGIDFTGRAR